MRRRILVGVLVALGGLLSTAIGVGLASDERAVPAEFPIQVDSKGQIIPDSVPDKIPVGDEESGTLREMSKEEYLRTAQEPPPPPGEPGGPDPAKMKEEEIVPLPKR